MQQKKESVKRSLWIERQVTLSLSFCIVADKAHDVPARNDHGHPSWLVLYHHEEESLVCDCHVSPRSSCRKRGDACGAQ